MRVAPALIAALLLPAVAQADAPGQDAASYLWFDGPNTVDAGDARMRIVFDGGGGAAALTPNQYWLYSEAYRRHLGHLAMRRPMAAAEGAARHLAFRDVVARYPTLRVEAFDLEGSYAETLISP